MQKTPSIDWPRRTSPLSGVEDLLKQNPSTDAAPQEERVPVSLISDYALSQLSFVNLGSGVGTFDFKLGSEVRLRSVGAASNKVVVSLDPDKTISLDVNTTNIAADIPLNKLQNVENVTPSNNQVLSYDTATNKWTPKESKNPLVVPLHIATRQTFVQLGLSNNYFVVPPQVLPLKLKGYSAVIYTVGDTLGNPANITTFQLKKNSSTIPSSALSITTTAYVTSPELDESVSAGDIILLEVISEKINFKDKGLSITLYFEPS